MIHINPTVWRKFSGETKLIRRVQAFLFYNVSQEDELPNNQFLEEAKALIHMIRKQDQADIYQAKKRRMKK